jgi:hypothetical protein
MIAIVAAPTVMQGAGSLIHSASLLAARREWPSKRTPEEAWINFAIGETDEQSGSGCYQGTFLNMQAFFRLTIPSEGQAGYPFDRNP